jgi:hypothetical protein
MAHDLVANVTAGVFVRPLFQEDGFDIRFEIRVIKLRPLRVRAPGSLRRNPRNEDVQQDGSGYQETSKDNF